LTASNLGLLTARWMGRCGPRPIWQQVTKCSGAYHHHDPIIRVFPRLTNREEEQQERTTPKGFFSMRSMFVCFGCPVPVSNRASYLNISSGRHGSESPQRQSSERRSILLCRKAIADDIPEHHTLLARPIVCQCIVRRSLWEFLVSDRCQLPRTSHGSSIPGTVRCIATEHALPNWR
jgi:hypothetical protein